MVIAILFHKKQQILYNNFPKTLCDQICFCGWLIADRRFSVHDIYIFFEMSAFYLLSAVLFIFIIVQNIKN